MNGTGNPKSPSSRLKVILAGHNGDVEVLRGAEGEFSPETLSAAYARISRFKDPVPELRRKARAEVGKARKSNRTIVFGLGHHSVAEHAVFNFDILGCSRLAIEALEWHRLCSYTEKSQRYITLDGDFVIPAEFDAADRALLERTVADQKLQYEALLDPLHKRLEQLHPEMMETKRGRTVVEGWAKEDARYVVSLATEGQLGFTANARNLELIVRRLRQAPLEEERRLGQRLFEEARQIAPSLVILADEKAFKEAYGTTLEGDYFAKGSDDLREAASKVAVHPPAGELAAPPSAGATAARSGDVSLHGHTEDPDGAVIAALLFTAGKGAPGACREAARGMTPSERLTFIRTLFTHFSAYDSPPRAFEEASFSFEILIDASALAQLKRHRMSTQLWGPYDPALGFTTPPAIEEIGEAGAFASLMERTQEAHTALERSLRERGIPLRAAAYILTNAHRRVVTVTMNLREIYHFSRLREDIHAQWAIRDIARDVSALVRGVAPASACLLCGKDAFAQRAQELEGNANRS